SELDIPPPNMSERPPPLPLCMRISRVRNRFARTSRICSPILTALTGEGGPSGSDVVVGELTPPPDARATPPRITRGRRYPVTCSGDVLSVAADRRELLGVDRRPADERPVDVVLGHQRRDVAFFDRPAVDDPGLVGSRVVGDVGHEVPDALAHLLGALRRRDPSPARAPRL